VDITQAIDRTTTIRASLRDTELTLLLAVGLVTVVVFLFLGDIRSTLIPSVSVCRSRSSARSGNALAPL
jgi:multidrug efflux pump